ncbi:DinB family protein [Arthrobacter echini]|uniref:DinB family protein n=1 Tax=Arthrobacter echini TaxID=1529066 RepID=A0A4S5EAF9_9MICC|nr:DinB family protein [Arthrobacter echini]THJ68573.1 DinB family protein [Arthrobacter echini]
MKPIDVLNEGYGRLPDLMRSAVKDLDADQLSVRPGGVGNSVAWLIWHLTRIADAHFSEAFGHPELWRADGYAERWGLSIDPRDTGWGHTSEQVDQVKVSSGEQLLEYFGAVHELVMNLIAGLQDEDLHRVVDVRWDPPVTLLVRLVSVLEDAEQHVGQAAYARGIILAAGSSD